MHPAFYEITLERIVLILSWDSNLVTRRHWDIYSQQWNTMGISVDQCIPYIMINPSWILVGGLEHFSFFHILGIIIPTDELIFFRGVGQPPGCLLVGVFQVLQFSEMMVPTGMVWGHPDLR